jgi:multiple sugar transport system substrate-binding protein
MTKKLKRFTVWSCVLLLVMSFASCSSKSGNTGSSSATNEQAPYSDGATNGDSGEVRELRFWTHYDLETREQQYLTQLAQRYTDEVDKNVQIIMESVPWDDYIGVKLITSFAAGQGPDIFLVSPPNFLKYYNVGVLKDLTAYISPEAQADFVSNAFDVTTMDGKIYGIPYELDLMALFYDVDLFEENGIEPPKTWDELKTAALALKSGTKAGVTFEIGASDFQVFMFSPFLWSVGGDVLTEDRKHSALNSPEVNKALSYWRDLMQSGAVNQKPSRHAGELAILAEGETAMQVVGSWGIGGLEKDYPDKRIGVVPIPAPSGKQNVTVAGGWRIVVNNDSAHSDDAAKFVAWAFANEDSAVHVQWDTEVKFAFPVRSSVLEKAKDVYRKGLRKDFVDHILGTERAEMRIPPEVSKILQGMIQEALYKTDASIEDIAKKYHEKLEDFLKDYEGML